MACSVLIFSIDDVRGGIIKKILKRNGFEALRFNKILGAKDIIASHSPGAVIFDTHSCFSEEINQIKNLRLSLVQSIVIVLGDPSTLGGFEEPNISKELFLSDPLDPELIVSKVKGISLRAAEKRSLGENLEGALKHFLRLE